MNHPVFAIPYGVDMFSDDWSRLKHAENLAYMPLMYTSKCILLYKGFAYFNFTIGKLSYQNLKREN